MSTTLQATSQIPSPPKFSTPAEERRHRKERLAAAFRLFSKFGFDEGVAGHITARDPERINHFWVNPFGMHFSQVKVSDLILVNDHGDVVEGNQPVNAAAFAIHSAGARSTSGRGGGSPRPLAPRQSMVHAGPPAGPASHRTSAPSMRITPSFEDFTGIVYERSEGHRISQTLGEAKAVILRNHGLLTVGQTVDEAAWWFITMERSCQAQLLAEAAGKPIPIEHESALITRGQLGTPSAGWFQFQPLWARITKEQPDLFD